MINKIILTFSFLILTACQSVPVGKPSGNNNSGTDIIIGKSTINDVIKIMEEPVLTWKNENGAVTQVAYSNQPIGYKTFIIKFDINATVSSISQTMNEKYFNQLQKGMSPENMRFILGPERSSGDYDDTTMRSYNFGFCNSAGKRKELKVIFDIKNQELQDKIIIEDPLNAGTVYENCKPYTNYKN